jgi:hypothetical protein
MDTVTENSYLEGINSVLSNFGNNLNDNYDMIDEESLFLTDGTVFSKNICEYKIPIVKPINDTVYQDNSYEINDNCISFIKKHPLPDSDDTLFENSDTLFDNVDDTLFDNVDVNDFNNNDHHKSLNVGESFIKNNHINRSEIIKEKKNRHISKVGGVSFDIFYDSNVWNTVDHTLSNHKKIHNYLKKDNCRPCDKLDFSKKFSIHYKNYVDLENIEGRVVSVTIKNVMDYLNRNLIMMNGGLGYEWMYRKKYCCIQFDNEGIWNLYAIDRKEYVRYAIAQSTSKHPIKLIYWNEYNYIYKIDLLMMNIHDIERDTTTFKDISYCMEVVNRFVKKLRSYS